MIFSNMPELTSEACESTALCNSQADFTDEPSPRWLYQKKAEEKLNQLHHTNNPENTHQLGRNLNHLQIRQKSPITSERKSLYMKVRVNVKAPFVPRQ